MSTEPSLNISKVFQQIPSWNSSNFTMNSSLIYNFSLPTTLHNHSLEQTNYTFNVSEDFARYSSGKVYETESVIIPQTAAMLATFAAISISVCGIVGNFLTILALIRFSTRDIRRRLTPNTSATTRFVIALAATDLFFCSAVLPFNAGRYWTRSWPFGEFACRLYPLIYYGTVASSLMLITAITINRLVLIAYHDLYRRMYSRSNVTLMIAFCWLFSYGIMLIPFFELYGKTGLKAQTYSCTVLRDSRNRSPKKFLFTFGFVLPAVVIVICYSVILIHVRAQTAKTLIGQRVRASKRDLRLTGLICVVFGTFLACFFPLFLGNVFIREDRYQFFHVVASIFAWMSSCINPWLYFAMNSRYRAALKRLLGCFDARDHSPNGQTSVSLSAFGTTKQPSGGVNIVSLKNSRKFSLVAMTNLRGSKKDSVKYSFGSSGGAP